MLDLEIKKFLCLVMAIQLALLGLIALALLGFDIPILRQLIGFVYLTFVPGLLILRIFKLRELGSIETLLYSVGLSLAFVMFLGFFMNSLYPLIGIPEPISIPPLIITLTIAIAILSITAYIRERKETMTRSPYHFVPWPEIPSPPVLFLLLLPLLSVLGTYLVNFHQNNLLLLVLIAFIALVVALVVFDRFIPRRLYPLAVVLIAISLLWHWSLISQYLWGWDIHIEYYYQNLVLANSSWDPTLYSSVNAMLSITMLAPIYSLLLNMDTIWIFKVVYPLFFSLFPLALFQVFRKQTNDRIAFFSVFFFMSFCFFFTGMLQLARQQIAELFFGLSMLLLLDRGMAATKRAALLIIFGISTGVSHYGTSYFYLFYLLLALLLLSLMGNNTLSNLWRGLSARFNRGSDGTDMANPLPNTVRAALSTSPLTATFVVLLVVFFFTWYMSLASSSPFNSIVRIGDHLYQSLSEFYILETREQSILVAMGLASPEVTSVQRNIYLVIQYITQFFIVAGVIGLLFNQRKTKFQQIYVAMTLGSALLLLLCVLLPHLAGFFNMDRIYHITLFFLAPFCVLGGITTFRWLFKVVPSRLFRASNNSIYLKLVVMLILIPYFLFGTAFIYAVTGDVVTSMALNPGLDTPRFNRQEVLGEEWLLSCMSAGSRVCADGYGVKLLYEHIYFREIIIFHGGTVKIPDNTYVYLRSLNVKQGEIMQSSIELQSTPFGKEVLEHRNKIYGNGGAEVYYQ